jgi:hypothetical protein
VNPSATGARNYSQCDSMLIGDQVLLRFWGLEPVSLCGLEPRLERFTGSDDPQVDTLLHVIF